MFRNHIAPALGITHRFVGTEPFCPTTNKYNSDMMVWLQDPVRGAGPALEVVEIPRTEFKGTAISASEVRRHLQGGRSGPDPRTLVPPATFELLKTKYVPLVAEPAREHSDTRPPAVAARTEE